MCSSPKPKKSVSRRKPSTPIFSVEMMARFTKVANEAGDRRQLRLDLQNSREQAAAHSISYRSQPPSKKQSYIDRLYREFMSLFNLKNVLTNEACFKD